MIPLPPPVLYTGTCHSPFIPKICFPNYITGTICHTNIFEKFSSFSEREKIFPKYITGTICHTNIFEKFSSLSERERIFPNYITGTICHTKNF
jgi:ribosomal protein S18